MERKKYWIIVALMFIMHTTSANEGYNKQIYEAYISGDMSAWKSVLLKTQNLPKQNNASLLEVINYQFGYIGWCIGTGKKTEAKKWMEQMDQNLDILEKKNYQPAMIQAYRGSMIGFRIGLNKYQAPFIGQKSIDYAKSAMQLDPKNPSGYILYGNILYYTPQLFGGSKDDAINHYLEALKKMESNKSSIHENWNYLSLLTVIANAYYEYDQSEKALTYLRKALQAEPNFQWVKNELYPKYLNKK